MHEIYLILAPYLEPFLIFYFISINFIYCILLFLGAKNVNHRSIELKTENFIPIYRSESLPEITFIMAAYNKSDCIVDAIDNLLNVGYEFKKIIFVNDGSTDNTLDLLIERYDLIKIPAFYQEKLKTKPLNGIYQSKSNPIITVLDKVHGEKYDALNAGLNACQSPYFININPHTRIDNKHFEGLIRPLFSYPENIALGAALYIKNGCLVKNNRISSNPFLSDYFSAMQSIEYIRIFLARQGWDFLGGNILISGSFLIFVTKVVKEVGGFAPTIANDMEMIIRLNRIMLASDTPYQITYLPDPVAYTEASKTYREIGKKRARWHKGMLEAIWFNKVLFLNPKYKAFGLINFTFLIISEAIEPFIELIAYIYIIAALYFKDLEMTDLFLLIGIICTFNFFQSLMALIVEESNFSKYAQVKRIVYLLIYSFIESIGYKQLNLYWRLKGALFFLIKFPRISKKTKTVNNLVKTALASKELKW